MAAFSDKALERFFAERTKDVEIGGATWTLRELSGFQLQELQSMLLTATKEGAQFDSKQLAPHYAHAIAYSVVAVDGEQGTLSVEQVKRLPPSIFTELREAIDSFNRVEEADEGKA